MNRLLLILLTGLCALQARSGGIGLAVAANSKLVLKGERPGNLSVFRADDLHRAGSVFVGGMPRGISVVGSVAYTACEEVGLKIVEFGLVPSPTVVGTYFIAGGASEVVVTGKKAYVLGARGEMYLLDVTDPANLREISVYESFGESFGINVVGTRAYLAKGSRGVEIVNVVNPHAPEFINRFDVGGEALGLVVSGGFAYAGCGSGGFKIFDVRDVSNPIQLGSINPSGTEGGVILLDQTALVVLREGGFYLVDVSIPSNPVLKSTVGDKGLDVTMGVGHGAPGGKDILFDCDPGNDIDDVADLVVLNHLANDGEANILGVMFSLGAPFGAPVIEIVNQAYGRPAIPIGVTKTSPIWAFDCYGSHLMTNFFHAVGESVNAPDAVSLYRKILARRGDHSVTVLVAGQLRNMSDLWKSGPDAYSSLPGRDLMIQKLERVVVVAGVYPQGWEYNFFTDPAPGAVVNEWNGTSLPVSFMGIENGDQVFIGRTALTKPANDPVRAGYEVFYPTFQVYERQAWASLGLMFAARGYSYQGTQLFTATKGQVTVSAVDGKNDWINAPISNVEYLRMAQPPQFYAEFLDELLMRPALQGVEPRAYVADEEGGLRAFNLTNAAAPIEFAEYRAPRLNVVKVAEGIVVSWPLSLGDYSLWSLNIPLGDWQKVSAGIEMTENGYSYSVAPGNAAGYFQLRR